MIINIFLGLILILVTIFLIILHKQDERIEYWEHRVRLDEERLSALDKYLKISYQERKYESREVKNV